MLVLLSKIIKNIWKWNKKNNTQQKIKQTASETCYTVDVNRNREIEWNAITKPLGEAYTFAYTRSKSHTPKHAYKCIFSRVLIISGCKILAACIPTTAYSGRIVQYNNHKFWFKKKFWTKNTTRTRKREKKRTQIGCCKHYSIDDVREPAKKVQQKDGSWKHCHLTTLKQREWENRSGHRMTRHWNSMNLAWECTFELYVLVEAFIKLVSNAFDSVCFIS